MTEDTPRTMRARLIRHFGRKHPVLAVVLKEEWSRHPHGVVAAAHMQDHKTVEHDHDDIENDPK